MLKATILFIALFCITGKRFFACTIVSGTDKNGQTWVMNNEDFFHTYSNYVNVFPAQGNKLGYITFTYGSPESGIQGGVNEAGVFFDINALPPQEYKLSKGRKPYESGNMLEYLLQHCNSVSEFLRLWETYYMPDMNGIQIHLADKSGTLAVITPDTIVVSKKHITTTNFNVCETGAAKQACWRYPISERMIAENGINKESLVKIADSTSWREFTTTLYTNIHNLSTGEIWFYLAEDYGTSWHTSIQMLLRQGKNSILLATKFPNHASLNLAKMLEHRANRKEVKSFLDNRLFNDAHRESMLRLLILNYLYIEKDFKKIDLLFPEWEKYLYTNQRLDSTEVKFTKAQYLSAVGRNQEAIHVLRSIRQPGGKKEELLSNLANTGDYNVTIDLNGYKNAKAVVLEVKGDYNILRPLTKTPDGWSLKLKTDRKQLKYCFYVDGQRVLDESKPVIQKQETVKGDFKDFNILKVQEP